MGERSRWWLVIAGSPKYQNMMLCLPIRAKSAGFRGATSAGREIGFSREGAARAQGFPRRKLSRVRFRRGNYLKVGFRNFHC